ncbi:MAG: hypothetical protein H6686_11585 [Fibrobacteria bacterium]|nr:hypothetical protein [Fibrobacteria bacterium]
MKAQGQTDQPLEVKLESSILRARWLSRRVAAGGSVHLEVATHFVADDSPISIEIRTVEDKRVAKLEGRVHADIHRVGFEVPADLQDDIFFTATLQEHDLETASSALAVIPRLSIQETKWYDSEGNLLEALQDGRPALGKAKILGRPEGTVVEVVFMLKDSTGAARQAGRCECKVSSEGGIEAPLSWLFGDRSANVPHRTTRERDGGEYLHPSLWMIVRCDGMEAIGEEIPIEQEMRLHFESAPGEAGPFKGRKVKVTAPDGEVQDFEIPEDGTIVVERTRPGHYEVVPEKVDP